jgi:hypothetical protein
MGWRYSIVWDGGIEKYGMRYSIVWDEVRNRMG